MGAGAVVFGVGTIGAIQNKKKIDDAEAKCPKHQCLPGDTVSVQDGNNARSALNRSVVVLSVGIAAVAGGALWWFLDKKAVDKANGTGLLERPRLAPFVAPRLAGLSLSGSF